MAKIQFYEKGHKPQYGAERWKRYEDLRVRGFAKSEARELSRVKSSDPVVKNMKRLRRRQVKEAEGKDWTRGQFYHAVRNWYKKNRLLTNRGRPSIFKWAKETRRRMTTDEPSAFDADQPHHKGYRTSDPKSQKKRARTRAKSFRDLLQSEDTPMVRRQKRAWIDGLRERAKREPHRSSRLLEQARNLGYRGERWP